MSLVMEARDISFSYSDDLIIDNCDFDFYEKSINAILAPNNSLKTTLIKVLGGVLVGNGKIIIDGVTLNKKNFKKCALNISIILDDIENEFLCDKVIDEIKCPLINLNYKNKDIDRIVDKVSDITNIKSLLDRNINSIKYYEKVKVLIAASIMHSPKVLLLDDIFRFLNKKEKRLIFNILNNIKEEYNMAIVFTTSSFEDVIGLSDIYVLDKGKVIMNEGFNNIILKDNELEKIGIEIPLMIDLSRKLQFYNLIKYTYYDRDKVVDLLWKSK